jgi:hypothetical protein
MELDQIKTITTRNRIIYSGLCSKCDKLFWSYVTNYLQYCSRSCAHRMNGAVDLGGYKIVYNGKGKQYKEHRLIMERYLGRGLLPTEHIHHINGNKLDNSVENLQIISVVEHAKLHAELKRH